MSPRAEGTTTRRRNSSRQRSASAASAAIPAQEAEVEEGTISPRGGAKKTMMHYIRQLPNYLRLLVGLLECVARITESLGDAIRALAGTEKVRPSFRALARQLGARIGGASDDPFNEPGNG